MASCRCVDCDSVQDKSLQQVLAKSTSESPGISLTSTRHANDHILVRYPKNPPTFRIVCMNSLTYQPSPAATASGTPAAMSDAAAMASCTAPGCPATGAVVGQRFRVMSFIPTILAICLGAVLNANFSAWLRARRGRESSSRGDEGRRDVPEVFERVALALFKIEAAVSAGIDDGSRTPDMMG